METYKIILLVIFGLLLLSGTGFLFMFKKATPVTPVKPVKPEFPASRPTVTEYMACASTKCRGYMCQPTDVACNQASSDYSQCLVNSLNYDQYAFDYAALKSDSLMPDSFFKYHNECVKSFNNNSAFYKIYECEATCGNVVV